MSKQKKKITDIRSINLMALFAALTAIGAFIRIPLPYVPITLQTIFVLLAGVLLGKRRAALSQLIYLVIGLSGVPIFTEGGGPGYIFKPSFGYLLAFVVAAYFTGLLTENRPINYRNIFLASTTGVLITYIIGVPYLYLILTKVSGVELGFLDTLKAGMIPFLPGDLLKILIVTIITPRVYTPLKKYL
ncbi:MAG: biotin transporter BioY [Halanaerobiales bacterium]